MKNPITRNIHNKINCLLSGNGSRGREIFLLLAGGGFLLVPVTVNAYIGPGAGLSLLGALWAFLLAVGTAIIFLFAWPIRRMIRRRREARYQEGGDPAGPETDAPRSTAADREEPVNQPRRQ